MLERLTEQPPDKIIALMGIYAKDPRPEKIDLGVGVYKDADGKTPVMKAVKEAERRLHAAQQSKSYVGLLGDLGFVGAMRGLIFGPRDGIVGAQTPGGTGAVRQLFELIKLASPGATVWYSQPTWPNHPAMLKYLGIPAKTYRYFDAATGMLDFAGMTEDLAGVAPGDVVLVHGCCHNPTGVNLSMADWQAFADQMVERQAVVMVDLAYQGFGDGLEEDVAGLRHLVDMVPEVLVAASCSKNFGLYRDRVGCAFVCSRDAAARDLAEGALKSLNRVNFSFPPDHGAKVVEIILTDPELTAMWKDELEAMRVRMLDLRTALSEALRRESNSDRFDFIARHRGMFSVIGASDEQVTAMREADGVYMVGGGRFNVAGLPADRLDVLAASIVRAGV